jgi:hypothetical protein
MLAVAAGTGLPGTEPVSIAHTAASEQARVATAELSLPLPLAAVAAAVAAAAAALTGELIAVAPAAATGSAGKLIDCCLLPAVVAQAPAGAVGARFLRCQNLPPPTAAEPVCCFLARASTYWILQLCLERNDMCQV